MSCAARFDAHQRLGLRLKEAEYLAAAELAAHYDLAGGIDRMDLEEALGDVETYGGRDGLCASLHGGRLLSLDASTAPSLAHRCRSGAVHPINVVAALVS